LKPEPIILAFDTSVAHCAAALLSGDAVLGERVEPMTKGQAERLFQLLEELLVEADISWSDLHAIGVGTGPGNFTGIRISVSAARGLALSLGIPAVGVSSFEAQAFGLRRPITSLIDARRDQIYVQELSSGGACEPILIPKEIAPDQNTVGPTDKVSPAAIARIAAQRYFDANLPRPAPLYVRAPDAAPPRDPAPAILP